MGMRIKKITTGFVIQDFCSETGKCVGQEFIAGDDVVYEDRDGNPVEVPNNEQYQTFDMIQPVTPVCEACGGHGFLDSYNTSTDHREIQRCDMCERFENDEAAVEYVVHLAKEHGDPNG